MENHIMMLLKVWSTLLRTLSQIRFQNLLTSNTGLPWKSRSAWWISTNFTFGELSIWTWCVGFFYFLGFTIVILVCSLLQLTSTMLHLLGLSARCDERAIQDLLVKVRRVMFSCSALVMFHRTTCLSVHIILSWKCITVGFECDQLTSTIIVSYRKHHS